MVDPQQIWSSAQLPTLPSVAVRLLELSRDPDSAIRDVIEVIRTDPVISARILKSTNSAYFGFKSEITSIERAVPLLGKTMAASIALSSSLVDASTNTGPLASHFKSYWMQSIVHAVTAELLGESRPKGLECDFFLSGLLVDVGRLAMLKTIGSEYALVLAEADARQVGLCEVESRMLGVDHVEIGSKLMEQWKLPAALIQAAQLHHAPVDVLWDHRESPHADLIQASAVAAAVGDYYCTSAKGPALERIQSLTREIFQLDEADLEDFLFNTKKRIDDASDLFSVNTRDLGDPSELMAEAMEQLAELAIRAHVANTQAAAPQALVEREQQELKVTNRQSQQRMLYDPLTKIYNRQFFDEALNNELARSIRQATSIGLVLCDVDHFKQINDTYSHLRGDAVLQRISRILRGVLRKSDVLARYGGEEFVILASQPTEKGLAKLAERIRERVEAEPFACEAKEFSVTISVGAVIALPSRHDETVGERLIAVADEQLDKAKHNGRNQVCLRSLLSDSEKRVAETVSSLRLSHWLVNRNILDLPSMAQALAHSQVNRVRIGELGERVGYLTGEQVGQIRDEQERSGKRFGATAIQLGFLSEETCADLLALQLEEPNSLAGALVEIGLLEPDYAAALIKEYLADTQVGQRRPNGVSMSS